MTSPKIQKDIKAIIDDLDEDYNGTLVDESKEISHHEQMALALRYVDKKDQVNEPFIGLFSVGDTLAKSLKEAIHSLLSFHNLSSNPSDRLHAKAYLIEINGFEFAFLLHLMLRVLVISNELSKALQRKEQDIVNAMVFLGLTRERLQKLREEGWKEFMDEVSSFCAKHDILVPKMEEFYIPGK
ncbi:uncharacterized protein LOC132045177 [Lycium ferocissimum]|uniref:uncharacterized protein LOC132045177 n=1 Tax=Lycium ferocissimum TaxID=112874 RepID=UPI002815E674|nr:uncharacterized protein LOC132045177 [Lycium ferocissimum]